MYLTKITLTLPIVKKYKLHDAYALHKLVYSLFPRSDTSGRLLYAARKETMGTAPTLLILSHPMPVIPENIEASSLLLTETFFSASMYGFEILMNPVKKDSKNGKRTPIIGQLPLLNWFVNHSAQWGFEVDQNSLEVQVLPSVVFPKGEAECRLHQVKYKGVLKVTDKAIFMKRFEEGLGHSKAFGFGLLQLVPLTMN